MSNALHDYAKLFERYAANNSGMGVILAGEDCLALANEMRMDADAIDAENVRLRGLCGELLRMAESNDPDFLHWPEIHDELRKLGVEIVKIY